METVKKSSVAKKPLVKEQNNSDDKIKILEEQVEGLKALIEVLVSNNNQTTDVPDQKERDVVVDEQDNLEPIPLHKAIKVTSLFAGGMTLRGVRNQPIRFEKFGVSKAITYEDLMHITGIYSNLAEQGYFFIHNQEVVKSLYLENSYKHIVKKEVIENLITLSDQEIEGVYRNLTPALQETFVTLVIQGIQDENPKFGNRNKISLISKLCGQDLNRIVEMQTSA